MNTHNPLPFAVPMSSTASNAASVEIGLNAAIAAVDKDQPQILVVRAEQASSSLDSLPYGPFTPREHRTLEIGLRNWVSEQTGLSLGYVEQLYTFGDRGRHAQPDDIDPHVVSIGYVALTRVVQEQELTGGYWRNWYGFFPWEDWREGKPAILEHEIEPRMREWASRPRAHGAQDIVPPQDRVRMCFALDGVRWDEEKVLERYELMYEAGLITESEEDGRYATQTWEDVPTLGLSMLYDHRRILATAMGRLRAKIKYRPVIFELMPDEFTLFELQKTVEAILGSHLHKQNFRRLVENCGLVDSTGDVRTNTGGRPAKLFRFRHEVLLERPAPGVRVHA